mmetsp:Transcript_18884/g.28303  ORF Transcript_18884/g.28303 Transcript_18884/m.28303 type:complete len:133 (-) Transcript_18884:372-770(-)
MTSYVLIHTTPAIHDPKELNAIIISSLRSMFGECQSYGVGTTVLKCRPCSSKREQDITISESSGSSSAAAAAGSGGGGSSSYEAIVECPSQSLPYLRAALTLPFPPSYLREIMYRFDFVKIVDYSSKPGWAE